MINAKTVASVSAAVAVVSIAAAWSFNDRATRAEERARVAQATVANDPGPEWRKRPDTPAATEVKPHLYDVHEGAEYGYTAALSELDRRAGKVANTIVMVGYAGERNGRHQVHVRSGNAITAFECAAPCEVIKSMTVMDVDGMRQQVQTEHLRAVPTMIAALALKDAMSGELLRYSQDYDGRPYDLWVSDTNGLTRQPAKAAAKAS